MTELESKDALILHLERTLKLERQSLRDQFAKAAMIGLLSNSAGDFQDDEIADAAYRIADAMMKERLK